jgi:dTDP-4-dehydrorhamnose reductase
MSFSSFELLDHSKPILVFGRNGQVGKALQVCLKDLKTSTVFMGRTECDLANEDSIRQVLNYYQPQVIINAAAYTKVDQAERDSELVFAINARAPELMAQYIAKVQSGLLIHYSADYVFGDNKFTPYSEIDTVGPLGQLNVYGKCKLSGELAIKNIFSANKIGKEISDLDAPRYLILRTSWTYGDGENFVRKILNLASTQNYLSVVDDQVGVPTDANWLAQITLKLAFSGAHSGIYHVVPDGETSWYQVAKFAIEVAKFNGMNLTLQLKNLQSITSLNYGSVAKRPYNSRMSNQKLKMALLAAGLELKIPSWKNQVESYVKNYAQSTVSKNNINNRVSYDVRK